MSGNLPDLRSAKEYLGSVSVGAVVHAAYPTAASTLCGVRFGRAVPNVRGASPDCAECAKVAAAFNRVDQSAPPHWRKP